MSLLSVVVHLLWLDSSGVYICKSIVNDLKHGNYICKSEGNYLWLSVLFSTAPTRAVRVKLYQVRVELCHVKVDLKFAIGLIKI